MDWQKGEKLLTYDMPLDRVQMTEEGNTKNDPQIKNNQLLSGLILPRSDNDVYKGLKVSKAKFSIKFGGIKSNQSFNIAWIHCLDHIAKAKDA